MPHCSLLYTCMSLRSKLNSYLIPKDHDDHDVS